MSPRTFQIAVLVLLAAGIGLLLLQQRRIGELERQVGAAASGASSAQASPPVAARPPLAARKWVQDPNGPPGARVMTGLTMEEALEVSQRLQQLPPAPPAASVTVPTFLAEQSISPAVWKKVQAVNERTVTSMHELARAFPSGTVAESEARLAKLENERKAGVSQLLSAEQLKAYEAMRTTGEVEGIIELADGAIRRWVYRY